MKVLDFHADDLLDREILGTLSDDDRAKLREHLEKCASCRLERQLRFDFDSELARRDEARALNAFITGAIREAHGPRKPARPARAPKVSSPTRGWGGTRHRMFFLAAATMIFGTGVAAANSAFPSATWGAAREIFASWLGGESSPRRAPEVGEAATEQVPRAALSGIPEVASAAPSPEPNVVPEMMPSAHPFAEPLDRAAHPPARVVSPPRSSPNVPPQPLSSDVTTAASAVSPGNIASPPLLPPAMAPVEPLAIETASGLFERANAARRQGAPLEASALYRDLQSRFPVSSEAKLSLAIMARMQLDRRETAAALAGFNAYYATGDRALREEALEGRAIALQRLGRIEEEKQAWQELLRAHPNSAYAGVARKRLGQDVP